MAQGVEFSTEERETIIESLRPFLEAGFSRNRACEQIGLHPTTLSKWVQADESLSMRLKGYENTLNMLALSNIASGLRAEAEMEGNQKPMSTWYSERRMKTEFSPRIESTGADGKDLPTPIVPLANVQRNHSNTEDSGPTEED